MISEIEKLIKKQRLSKNQKTRWRKEGTVPVQAILEIRKYGIILTEKEPVTGMHISTFLEQLWIFTKSTDIDDDDGSIRSLAMYIYQDTITKDWHPNWREKMKRNRNN